MKGAEQAFESALEYATGDVERWLNNAPPRARGPEEYIYWWAFKCRHMAGPDGKSWIDAHHALIDTLCKMALDNFGARQLLNEIVSSKLVAGIDLSPNEARFAGFAIAGGLPKLKTPRGVKRDAKFERNVFLLILAYEIKQRFGLRLTRNDASKSAFSACDVVAMAFQAAGRHEVTFKTVKELCSNRLLQKHLLALSVYMNDANHLPQTPYLKALAG